MAFSEQRHLPWFTVPLGIVLVLMGVWMLSGRSLTVPRLSPAPSRPWPASEPATPWPRCPAPSRRSWLWSSPDPLRRPHGIVLFLAYAAGMGLVVGALAIATALASHRVVTRLRHAGRWTPRIADALLAVAGSYFAYYGAWELRLLGGAEAEDPVIDTAATNQQSMASAVDTVGAAGWLALGGLLPISTGLLVVRQRRSARAPTRGGRDR